MQLAISISQTEITDSMFFKSGMLQNIKFFYELLENIGYEPFFLNFSDADQETLKIGNASYRCRTFNNTIASKIPIGIVFEVGITVNEDQRDALRTANGSKIVVVKYGNSMIMDIESVIFNPYNLGRLNVTGADQVWYSPHFELSKHYFQSIFGCDAVPCPYLWEPDFITKTEVEQAEPNSKPSIYVMEPNINVVKSALIPLCIIDALYKSSVDSFDKAIILNGLKLQKNQHFVDNVVTNLPSTHAENNKVFFSPRATFDQAFAVKNILLGHHWENALNYLYCEAIYKGVPLVHNSDFFKDVGYFYSGFNVSDGVGAMEQAIANFTENEDIEKNRAFLSQYSVSNIDVQAKYQKLIDAAICS